MHGQFNYKVNSTEDKDSILGGRENRLRSTDIAIAKEPLRYFEFF